MLLQGKALSGGLLKDKKMVIFDLDGTLRMDVPSASQFFYDHAVQLGVDDCPEKRRRAARWAHYYWAQSQELEQDIRKFSEMDTTFWENYAVRSLLAFDCSDACARELAPDLRSYMDENYQPHDRVPSDVPGTLQSLQDVGFRLGLLTNRSSSCREHLVQLGLENYFEQTFVAGEVGAWKPDPQIFFHALETVNLASGEVIYVGDNYYADVIGAQRAGIQPVLFDPLGLFPEAECPVISKVGDLCEALDQD